MPHVRYCSVTYSYSNCSYKVPLVYYQKYTFFGRHPAAAQRLNYFFNTPTSSFHQTGQHNGFWDSIRPSGRPDRSFTHPISPQETSTTGPRPPSRCLRRYSPHRRRAAHNRSPEECAAHRELIGTGKSMGLREKHFPLCLLSGKKRIRR